MGARGSHTIQPEELPEFRRLDDKTSTNLMEIPVKPENRTVTDKAFSIAYSITLIIAVSFVTYTLVQYRDELSDHTASSVHFTNLKPHSTIFIRYLRILNWPLLAYGLCVAIIFAMIVMVLLRYCTAAVVWATLVLAILVGILGIVLTWLSYVHSAPENGENLHIPIIFTIIFALFIVVSGFLFRRISLVILLFKEAALSLFALPGLLLLPIINSLSVLGAFAIFATSEVYLHNVYTDPRYGNTTSLIALILNAIMLIWTLQFLYGFQCMVIAGAVSTRYFARNKQHLNWPIATSLLNIFKFHLGSIFFGSLIITLVIIPRLLLSALTKNEKLKIVVESCMSCIGDFVKYLTKNAYIETAMHGQPFWRSGKRAAKLLARNAMDMIAVNYIGDLVIAILVVLLELLSFGLNYPFYVHEGTEPYLFCLFCVFITTYPIFIIFETCVDTVFICFCEDREINDGLERPFCMSKGLMMYMDKSKQAKAPRN